MRPKELKNVSFSDIFSGKAELPEGITREKMLVALLQVELHQILTHSRVEQHGDMVRYFLHAKLRAEGKINPEGALDGEMRILWPDGSLWILANYRAGLPCGRWSEYLSNGLRLPGRPFEWLELAILRQKRKDR